MTISEIITIAALVIVPISAVMVGQYLQDRSKKKDEKMQIFKVLMTARIYGWTETGVQALNMIDVIFAKSKKVRNAWKEYRASLFVANEESFNKKDAETKHHKLLEAISDDLGYRGKITWETIQNPYIPTGLYNMWEEQSKAKKEQASIYQGIDSIINSGIMNNMMRMIPPPNEPLSESDNADNTDK